MKSETKQTKQTIETDQAQITPNKAVIWFTDNYSKFEQFGVAVSFVGYILKLAGVDGWAPILGAGLTTLASILFIGAHRVKDLPSGIFGVIISNVCHIAASIAVIGMMFYHLNLPGYDSMLNIGAFSLLISGLLLTFKWIMESEKYRSYAIRALVVLAFTAATYFGFL